MNESATESAATSDRHVVVGGLRRTVLLLALPALGEQFLSFLVGIFDVWLSGNFSGNEELTRNASSAVGTGAYIGWLASLLFGMVGTGTTALVSRFWGRGDHEQANRVANRSIALAGILGAAVCLLFFSAAPWLALFLDMQGEQYRIAVRYLRFDAFGHLVFGFSIVGSAALRGAGDTRSPMVILGFVSVMNMIMSPLLVFGPGPVPQMGVDGIVTGTIIARCSGGALMLIALARGRSGLKLFRRELLIRGDVAARILRVGVPAAIDGLLIWSAQVFFLKIINAIDQTQPGAYAAHMVGITVEAISYLPAVAWGYAAATVVGQSLGAEDRTRARRAGNEAVRQCALAGLAITALFFFGAETIFAFMHESPAVHVAGVPAFRMNALAQIPLAMSIIYLYALRGAGDTRMPAVINVIGVYGVRVPLAYVFGIVMGMGLLGAWIGMVVDVVLRGGLLWHRFQRGGWMHVRV